MDVPFCAAERYISYSVARVRAGLPRFRSGVKTITKTTITEPKAKTTRRKPTSPDTALAEAAKVPGTPRKKAAAAGPKKSRTKREAVSPDVLEKMLGIVTTSLDEDGAVDIVTLDLVGRASFADRMVIATGLSDRQISAMAHHIERKLGEEGFKRVLVEGTNGSDWVLIDIGDIVVHLFKQESRELYALERMWGSDIDSAEAEVAVGSDEEQS
ncbi:ribosome silencing factor [Gluconobacter wancherniae]|nr:ribosome silencing factor [Gluconobacter wancherniae]MBS1062962.1 ribosome silencing factor [Gluconobacter wancherniae]MBS1095700.1 ribosome silencing factor [Gluconobacter wancherniae]